jgi:hypothetical protein
MPLIQPDLSEIPKPIEPGTYSAKIQAVELGTSKSGNPKLVIKIAVNENGKEHNRELHMPYQGKGASGFGQLLRAVHMGDLAERLASGGSGISFNTDDLIGQAFNAVVEQELYNGQPQDKIIGYLPA